jgi:hypothetical protein
MRAPGIEEVGAADEACANCQHLLVPGVGFPLCGNPKSEFANGPVCPDGYCPEFNRVEAKAQSGCGNG